MAALIGKGLNKQLAIGRANLDLNSATNRFPPDAEAGLWIRSHTDANAVVMAGSVPTVFHYSNRKVVWFPPSSNPQLLMQGMLRLKVDFLIVVLREFNYYHPSEKDCFAPLIAAYPDAFRLVHQAPEFRIYQVNLKSILRARDSLQRQIFRIRMTECAFMPARAENSVITSPQCIKRKYQNLATETVALQSNG